MKKKMIVIEIYHSAHASSREIIENYVDYGHEVYLHGKYSNGQKKNISKITQVTFRILSRYEREVIVPVSFFMGLVKYSSIQHVTLIPWTGIHSEGELYGFPACSNWTIRERSDPDMLTTCKVIYEMEVPWLFYWLKPLFRIMLCHLRERIWEEDRIMLERRDRLMKRGFGDWGVHPDLSPVQSSCF